MQSFKDTKGQLWDVEITVATVRRVKRLVSGADGGAVDLMDAVKGELIAQLADDPVLLVDVLYAVCKPQADVLQISDEEFGSRMAGDVIADATSALVEGLAAFFPKRQRDLIGKTWAKVSQALSLAAEADARRLDDPRVSKAIAAICQQESERLVTELEAIASGPSSTSSPEQSESTQAL